MLNELCIECEVIFSCHTSLWRFPDCILWILGHSIILMILLASLSLRASSSSFTYICVTLWETRGKRRGRPCRVQYFHAHIYLLQSYFSQLLDHIPGLPISPWHPLSSLSRPFITYCQWYYLSFTVKIQLAQDIQVCLPFVNYQTSISGFVPWARKGFYINFFKTLSKTLSGQWKCYL